MRVPGRLVLLSALYFVEGLPWGFQSQALPIFLRTHHESLTAIGLLSLLSLPWMTKALWAPLVDRFGSRRFGRRKTWIVPMQLGLTTVCLFTAHAAAHDHMGTILVFVFAMNVFAATMDIAVDALAVGVLQDRHLGRGNITQVVGYKLGALMSGGLLVYWTKSIGWPGLFRAMAVLVAVVTVATVLAREPEGPRRTCLPGEARGPMSVFPPAPRFADIVFRLRAAAIRPGTIAFLAYIATYKAGEQLVESMFKPFLLDVGYPAEQIGLWVGTFGMVASIAGSFSGGFFAARMPLIRAVTVATCLRLLPLVGFFVLTLGRPSPAAVIVATVAEHFFGGVLTTAVFALMMSQTDRRVGATHYAMLATVEMLGKASVPIIAGPIAQYAGYPVLFGLGSAVAAALMLLLIPLRKLPERLVCD